MSVKLGEVLTNSIEKLFGLVISPELTKPDSEFGDYSTNVALKIASQLSKSPMEIAEAIKSEALEQFGDYVKSISVIKPGFINIFLSDSTLGEMLVSLKNWKPETYNGKTIVAEYSDPNPFKVLHAGHLYTSVVGDAIANLFEVAGAKVHRVNFGGDVGLHVAKTLWAIVEKSGNETDALIVVTGMQDKNLSEKASWLAERYVEGNTAYEDKVGIDSINDINARVYKFHSENDRTTDLAKIYWICRQWSYDYFDDFYESIGSKFEKYYPESQTAEVGLKKAKELLEQGILKTSEGAVVFPGEEHGLHTRVFITSKGLPTYESKDLGLQLAKWDDYHFDKSVIITGNDIIEYMKVVLKVVSKFEPKLAENTVHLTHGMVKLKGGEKMSSRKGNTLRAQEVIDITEAANHKNESKDDQDTTLAAIKYAFLKQKVSGDIIYDPKESISIEGNSGPYLQYAHARARSIIDKSKTAENSVDAEYDEDERKLAAKIVEYPEVITHAIAELSPHYICTFLYELAQVFNRFYENNRVIDNDRESLRIQLVKSYAEVLKSGLTILNIASPERI